MEEEEALKNYCRTMIPRVRHKQRHRRYKGEEEGASRDNRDGGGRRRRRTETGRQVGDDGERNLPIPLCEGRETHRPSSGLMCQGPEVQPVPLQLISMLRLKTLQEDMRRAADVELHDPAACNVCEQEQASLALRSFIRRKKTQLQFQTLKGRLNTQGDSSSMCKVSQSRPMPLAGFGRNYLVKICGSQQPGVVIATTEERGVTLATDEMRGHPDKGATGTHLARPHCPFPDR